MDRMIFPKEFITRANMLDFSDDGCRFKGYMYKGELPIFYCRDSQYIYLTIRPDYNISENLPTDRYNGTPIFGFNMDKFLQDCEECYQAEMEYRSPEGQLRRANRDLEDVEAKIALLEKKRESIKKVIDKLSK